MKSHTVDIAGQKVSLRSDAGEAHLRRLADDLNRRARQLRQAHPGAPTAALLALVAIRLADELAELRERADRERVEAAGEVRLALGAVREAETAVGEWLGEAERTGGEAE